MSLLPSCSAAGKVFPVQVEPHVGELVQAVTVTPEAFTGLQGVFVHVCVVAWEGESESEGME